MKLDAIQYIPHEQPMVFIDHLTEVAEGRAQAELRLHQSSCFVSGRIADMGKH